MAYIPEEHKQYPVLPYSRENGGEVFQYHSWPHQKLVELIGDHLMPYGYKSYEEYLGKIDGYLRQYAENPEAVSILEKCRKNIIKWNRKEEWSICKYIGEDNDDIPGLGLHTGGYYYWPCTADNPVHGGVIDDEEFTAYVYPTDSDLWEIIVDPTGMAERTIYGGEDAMTGDEYSNIMAQLRDKKPEDLTDVTTLGPIPRLNECERRDVRYLGDKSQNLIPGKVYAATVLEDGRLLVGDETGEAKVFEADQFEIVLKDYEKDTKVIFGSYIEYDEQETLARVNTLEDEVPLNISLKDGSDMDLKENESCSVHLWTNDYAIDIYSTEKEYNRQNIHMAPISMIPTGTFPANPDEKDFKQNASILFSGIVKEIERNPDPREGAPIWRLGIETYPFYFDLFYYEDEPVVKGNLVHGRAWLYGTLKREG